MLRSLRLRDFVIVESARIEFGPGFSVLTGETGAGKSILLDALGLALGSRADAAMVREGAPRADISAEFATDAAFDARLAALDLAGDPGALLMRRIIEADGRSRALVNGHPTTVTQLREIGSSLVDIHGQHESQSLMRAGAQRELLDRYGGLDPQTRAVAGAWTDWQESLRALDAARAGSRELALRIERLEDEIAAIDELKLAEGEWEALEAEQSRLAHARELLEGAGQLSEALARGDDALADSLRGLQSRLRSLAAIDASLGSPLEMLDSALIQIDEAAGELASYAQRGDLDPHRLAEVENRVAAIFATARKLRLAPDELVGHLARARAEFEEIGGGRDLDALERRVAERHKAYQDLASALSKARRKVADTLGALVSSEIDRLGMAGARFVVRIDTIAATSGGIDAVEFGIAARSGATPRPIARFASGGELSRIGLAIAVLAARANPVPTLIFDEADAGIGGTVAAVVGELMQRLGAACQVLCVTHLAQVASRADHHLLVVKADPAQSRVQALDDDSRIDEIARMLGTRKMTEATRAHAKEVLETSRRGVAQRTRPPAASGTRGGRSAAAGLTAAAGPSAETPSPEARPSAAPPRVPSPGPAAAPRAGRKPRR
ncbi:MAG: DNA repair protein RecN [Lautropia sp.]